MAKRPATKTAAKRRLDPASTVRVPKQEERKSERMSRTADFSGVGEYANIRGGSYEVEAQSYEWKDPKPKPGTNPALDPDTGKPYQYASMKWAVRDEVDDQGNKVEGHVLFNTYSKNPKSLFALKRDAIALGEDPETFDDGTEPDGKVDIDKILGAMIGRSGLATVTETSFTREDGSEKKGNNIDKVQSLSNVSEAVSARR